MGPVTLNCHHLGDLSGTVAALTDPTTSLVVTTLFLVRFPLQPSQKSTELLLGLCYV
jgi:hypothetical protein